MQGDTPLSRFTVHVPQDFGERLQNARVALGLSVAALLQQAVTGFVLDLERHHNAGLPFPNRQTQRTD